VVPARRPDAAREALAGIDGTEVDEPDLADLESVRALRGPLPALVNRLWPAIERAAAEHGGARVVAVSSTGHFTSPIRWDDLHFATGYDTWAAYGQAKTANALFALHLDTLAADRGVRAFSLHPGGIITPLQRHLPKQEMVDRGWIDEDGEPLNPAGSKSPEQGAATQTRAADPEQAARLWALSAELTGVNAFA
jgi:NAD(P)-dependent dehydrogenase (short-subunit alcohol dehydrogenase family)